MVKSISKLPVLRTIIKAGRYVVLRLRHRRSDRDAVKRLSQCSCPQGQLFANVLETLHKPLPPAEANRINRIEQIRKQMLKNQGPLVDGSLGEGGLFDKDVVVSGACKVSKLPRQCLFMYRLIRTFRPKRVIELGTNVGISSAYQAVALSENGPEGRLMTLEASPYRLRLARQLHQQIGLENVDYVQGLFSDTLPGTLTEFGPVDFIFIDGHHQYKPTLDYFEIIRTGADPAALFVFDDIRWSEGMERAWRDIQNDSSVGLAVDLTTMGICVIAPDPGAERCITPPIFSPLSSVL